ncbi:MAG: NAD-binding protein [Spirochaetaceae bacterium]|jgi:trk system potassium uptake protein TrkA|nr:NAD-binding protein [Spirochaetaceae bacterium]
MRVIIVGAGTVGTELARQLVSEKHDVLIIENDADRARHASSRLDCQVIQNSANNISVLEEAGVAKADALITVTDSDELNMIVCGLASAKNPDMIKIARVRNNDYIKLADNNGALGINHFVHPNVEAARSALDAIAHGAMGDILSFHGTPFCFCSIDIETDSAFDGLILKNYTSLNAGESMVILLEREKEDKTGFESITPVGSTVLNRGDRIHLLAREDAMDTIFSLAGRKEAPLRKIGIVGGGRLGALIAEGILDSGDAKQSIITKPSFINSIFKKFMPHIANKLTIIEQDYDLCKELSERFPQALILNEDITDENFIAEERIDGLDLIITATEMQELNIITAVYLKSRGVRRAISMVTSPGYGAIARKLGIDVVIPMKSVVVDSILTHLIGGGVKGLHRLGEGKVNLIELKANDNAPVTKDKILNIHFPPGVLLLLVNRGEGNSFIPHGDTTIQSGDQVALITKSGTELEVAKFFATSET